MSEQGDPTPRRALPPRDDEPEDAVDDGPAPRRGEWSATGPGAESTPSRAGTPIPPPAVLPVPDVAPASAGRRFSAVDLPEDEDRPLPRRSALSPAATRAIMMLNAASGRAAVAWRAQLLNAAREEFRLVESAGGEKRAGASVRPLFAFFLAFLLAFLAGRALVCAVRGRNVHRQ